MVGSIKQREVTRGLDQPDELATVAVRIVALALFRKAHHIVESQIARVFGVAKQHAESGHRGREAEVDRRWLGAVGDGLLQELRTCAIGILPCSGLHELLPARRGEEPSSI